MLSKWATLKSVKQLQLASLSICSESRACTAFHLRVVRRTPKRLWTTTSSTGKRVGTDGVPPMRVDWLTFREYFEPAVRNVVWRAGLRKISFGKHFNHPLTGVTWPAGLRAIVFGFHFDQPIESVVFPPGLEELEFGPMFDQDVNRTFNRRKERNVRLPFTRALA
ncbi:conserved unknown protein [Ectocarpus siliculosus]|uniref:Uncharacterized protein n=1 Tax=Ectocarpus siliculosus TaxID=2880 RepID=D7G4C1_ECTSI|nr:conserved unknown protein [Ectocarpus siliculosus]|eukprot:CBJ27136.1 conserved unknown protein [Ectocarpus siliculosus]